MPFLPDTGTHLEHLSHFYGYLITQPLPLCLLVVGLIIQVFKYEEGIFILCFCWVLSWFQLEQSSFSSQLKKRQESKSCWSFQYSTSGPLADLTRIGSTNSREMLLNVSESYNAINAAKTCGQNHCSNRSQENTDASQSCFVLSLRSSVLLELLFFLKSKSAEDTGEGLFWKF